MTGYFTLICPDELADRIDHFLVSDCRHDLFKHGKGAADYALAHLPGAFFLSMDDDLSGPKGDGSAGRHPLPDPAVLRSRLAALGLTDSRQLVVYDADNGTFAARLWWMSRWLGHEAVALLRLPRTKGIPRSTASSGTTHAATPTSETNARAT